MNDINIKLSTKIFISTFLLLTICIGTAYLPLPHLEKIYYYLFRLSPEECQNYFPNYHKAIYLILKILPYFIIILGIVLSYFIHKKSGHIIHSFGSKLFHVKNRISIPKNILFNLIVSLIVCLFFYFSIRINHIFPQEYLSNYQLLISRFFILIFSSLIFSFVYFNKEYFLSIWNNFLYQNRSPYQLAFLRILIFPLFGTWYAYFHNNSTYWLESTEKTALPYMAWFIHSFDLSIEQYQFICILGIISAFFITIGFMTRWMLFIHMILGFLIIATPNFYGKLTHDQTYIWIPWILAFSRCYDVWSLDAWIQKIKKQPFNKLPSSLYGIPIKIIWLHFGIIYFFAGFYKLWDAGFDWALSDSMLNQIMVEWVQNYDWTPNFRIDHYPNLAKMGGLSVILFELAFPFLLFKFRTRIFAIIGGLSFHKISGYFMKISFLHLQMLYIFFINWDWLFHKFQKIIRLIQLKSNRKSILKSNSEIYFEKIITNKEYTKPLKTTKIFYFGMSIWILNLLCGAFSIHSYPFSAYPSYSEIISNEIQLLHFEGSDHTGKNFNILQEAQSAGFPREHYTVFENNIIAAWQNQENYEKQITDYWKIWTLKIPVLQEISHLKVYYHKTPLKPEQRKDYIVNELIYEGKPK